MQKKYFKFVAYFPTAKNDSFLTVFAAHFTVSLPQKYRRLHTKLPKTPPKNKGKQPTFLPQLRPSFFCTATFIFLTSLAPASPAQLSSPQVSQFQRPPKQPKEDIEWLWQYSPPPAEGRENDLVLDPRFRPFLAQYFTAPQTFWGNPKTGYKSLADTALDHLSVPDKVLADDNRYLSITGCVFHFNPSRGLLWVDLNGAHPLIVFAAIDWIKESKTPSEPGAEYTLWVFPNHPLDPAHIPAALTRSVARWTAQPPAGSTVTQHITNAIFVDPDGTPHQIQPVTIGANTQTEQKAQP
jgi:hypothetical protein